MHRVIISGAGGFLGSALTRKMVENGIQVVAISLLFANDFPQSELVTKIEANIETKEDLLRIIPVGDYDAFYHLAWRGVNGPEKADPMIQTENIKLTLASAIAAKELNCKRLLCAGTVAEQAIASLSHLNKVSGGMMYGTSKHCAHLMLETMCKNLDLAFVWMQFSNIYGPNNKTGNLVSYTISELSSDKEALFGPALQPYDFVYVDDLIEAVYRLGFYQINHNCYYIGSGSPRILKEYLGEIGEILNKKRLINIGSRPDDGVKYSFDMFNTEDLVNDIGNYVSHTFDEGIKYTIENY